MLRISETTVRSGNLELWTESFGDVNRPTVLLIIGGMGQGILWPDDFFTRSPKMAITSSAMTTVTQASRHRWIRNTPTVLMTWPAMP